MRSSSVAGQAPGSLVQLLPDAIEPPGDCPKPRVLGATALRTRDRQQRGLLADQPVEPREESQFVRYGVEVLYVPRGYACLGEIAHTGTTGSSFGPIDITWVQLMYITMPSRPLSLTGLG